MINIRAANKLDMYCGLLQWHAFEYTMNRSTKNLLKLKIFF